MSIKTTVFNVLNGDTTLRNYCADWTDGAGNPQKAIFSIEPIPQDMGRPYIHFQIDSRPLVYRDKPKGRIWTVDIKAIADATGDEDLVDAMADRIEALFDFASLSITGFGFISSLVQGRRRAPTDHTRYGRLVTVEIQARRA